MTALAGRPGLRGRSTLAVLAVVAGCAPPTTEAPDLEVVWDIVDSTEVGGRGPYFMGPNAPRLRPGPVFVAWSCSGSGTLSITPAIAAHDGEEPPATSPLAFRVGGENLAQVRLVGEPSGPIAYRFVFAQARTATGER
jgi:hypothetical protein